MLSLKFILDTLKNNFTDNRIIENQNYTEAVITSGKIAADGIDTIFPIGCYINVVGSVFNNNYFKVTASGTDYIEATGIVLDPKTCITVKACLIPQEVIDFSLIDHKIPTLDSESIGNYSYSTSTPGVEGFVKNSLSPYFKAVTF